MRQEVGWCFNLRPLRFDSAPGELDGRQNQGGFRIAHAFKLRQIVGLSRRRCTRGFRMARAVPACACATASADALWSLLSSASFANVTRPAKRASKKLVAAARHTNTMYAMVDQFSPLSRK
jgi:hypothetical protein